MNAIGDRIVRADQVSWRLPLLVLASGLLLLALLFHEEGAAALRVWNGSTAYNHCWLVAPIAAWLAWQRRHRLAGLAPRPMPGAALLMVLPVLAWFAAERLGIMEGRQLAVIGMLWGLALAVLGWRVCRAMAAPLSYLVFLVPFGDFATPLLQEMTARMIEVGLRVWGLSYWRDGMLIETRAGVFHVAEACAGLRFLIAALAFGALYAFVLFRSPGRRLLVMVLAVIVPVVANGIRALGIVVAAEYLGSAEAAAADHVIYGWGFFSAVLLLLILAGLPFREDHRPEQPLPRPSPILPYRSGLAVAAAPAFALLAAGPLAAAGLDRAAGAPREVAPVPLVAPEGCEVAGPGALRCGGASVTVRLVVFPPRVTWAPVEAERRRAYAGGSDEDTPFTVMRPGTVTWLGREYKGGEGAGATAAWLGGRPAGGLRSRVEQAWASVAGGVAAPVVAVALLRTDPASPDPRRAGALLRAVLEAQDGLAARGAELSRGR